MKKVNTLKIKKEIIKLIHDASFTMKKEFIDGFNSMKDSETSDRAGAVLDILLENAAIAESESLPLCQDCGSTIVFIEIGQDVILEGKYLHDSINEAVAEAYEKYYLRKSITGDPLRRGNTGSNTPAFIHTEIIKGDSVRITVFLKGGGSENMSALKLFRPTDPLETIIDFIEETVVTAGPNPCPPIFLGVGIGGTSDTALLNSKLAPLRETEHPDPFYRDLEHRIKERLNSTGVGPLGLGGRSTCAGVYIKEAPAHIATLPVALNLNCHSFRYGRAEI